MCHPQESDSLSTANIRDILVDQSLGPDDQYAKHRFWIGAFPVFRATPYYEAIISQLMRQILPRKAHWTNRCLG